MQETLKREQRKAKMAQDDLCEKVRSLEGELNKQHDETVKNLQMMKEVLFYLYTNLIVAYISLLQRNAPDTILKFALLRSRGMRCCFAQILKVVHSVSDRCFFMPLRKAIRYSVNVPSGFGLLMESIFLPENFQLEIQYAYYRINSIHIH